MQSPQTSFDLIDSAGYGYLRVWRERQYLMKLATFPLLIKFMSLVAVSALGLQTAFLRQGLIMLPASFAEGWVIAQFMRTLLMQERWPMTLPPKPHTIQTLAPLFHRARGVVASTIVYVLLIMGMFVIKAIILSLLEGLPQEATGGSETQPDIRLLMPVLLIMGLMIWAFRFFWIYIPISVLMPLRDYARKTTTPLMSGRLLCLWLMCYVPGMVAVMMITAALLRPYGEQLGSAPSIVGLTLIFIHALFDMVVTLIASTAIAFALRRLITPVHPKAFADFEESPRA